MSDKSGDANKDSREEANRKLGSYLRYSGVGLQFLISILLCLWAGSWLDGKTGLSPLFLVLGVFIGFAAGTWAIYMDLFGRRR
jgi:F0F1-type ATP synthase assembly protein I